MARDITIRYVGDSKSAEAAAGRVARANQGLADGFKRVSDSAEKNLRNLGRSMSTAGRSLSLGVTLPLAAGFALATKAAEESQKVTKDTQAVIESMGGRAKVTAKQVADLSAAISRKTGIDDESIQVGQNLLLTFGNIRNEVGKGNDIFNQASVTAVDLAARFKMDIPSAAKILGKALNDPIGGITALKRAGVQFTDQQKSQIKTMVESGDILGAQRVIMAELADQTAGSAAAQATATDKIKVAFDELAEKVGTKLLPFVERFATWLTEKAIPAIERLMAWFGRLNPTIQKFAGFGVLLLAVLGPLLVVLGSIATAIAAIGIPVLLVVAAIALLVGGVIYAYTHFEGFRNVIQSIVDWITGTVIPALQTFADWFMTSAVPAIQGFASAVGDAIGEVVDWFTVTAIPAIQTFASEFTETFSGLAEAVTHIFNVIKDVITVAMAIIVPIVKAALEVIQFLWNTFGQTIIGYVQSVWQIISGIIQGFMVVIQGIIKTVMALINGEWGAAWEGIKQIFYGIWVTIQGLLQGFLTFITALLSNAWRVIGDLTSVAWTAIQTGISAVWETIKSGVGGAADWVYTKVIGVWNSIKSVGAGIWRSISSAVGSAWDGIKSKVRGAVNFVIGIINGLISGVNWVLNKLGLPTIGKLSAVGGGGGSKGGGTGAVGITPMASGGVVGACTDCATKAAGGFKTSGPQVLVGEGKRQYPEYVIPTDPAYRNNAMGLYASLGRNLMPGMQFGGWIGDVVGAGKKWITDRAKGVAGSVTGFASGVFRGALSAGFAGPNALAKRLLDAAPNPFGIRDIAQGLREAIYDWVKGADSGLPTTPPPSAGGGARPRGSGLAGLHEPMASLAAAVLRDCGGSVWIGSGWRSKAAQEALRIRNGCPGVYVGSASSCRVPTAIPGTSKHEQGLAVDWGGNVACYQSATRRHGGHFPVSGEHWHAQALGYQMGGLVARDGPAYLHRGEEVIRRGRRGEPVVVIENLTIQANTEAEGRAAGKGFHDVLASRRVVTDARIA